MSLDDSIEPLSHDLAELLATERARPAPEAAIGQRVGARVDHTLAQGGAPSAYGAARAILASRAFLYVVAAVLSIGCVAAIVIARRRPSELRPAPSGTVSSEPDRPARFSPFSNVGPLQLVSGTAEADPSRTHGSFEGTVFSSGTGLPIARAQLVFSREGRTFPASTIDDGSFTFDAPETGKYALAHASAEGFVAFAPAWGESAVEVVARTGTKIQGARIYLAPAIEYVGVVRDPSNRPVARASVHLLNAAAGRLDHSTTDDNGEFRLVLIPEDTVVATHSDLGAGRQRIDLSEQTTHRVVVRLGEKGRSAPNVGAEAGAQDGRSMDGPGSLRGKVYNASSGRPLAAFSVVVWSRIGAVERKVAAVSSFFDADGEYEVRGLPPGDYAFTAIAEGFASATKANVSVRGKEASATTHDFHLERGARLRGTVVDDATKRPIAGARVSVEGILGANEAPVRLLGVSLTDEAGHFELTGLASGVRSVRVTEPHHHGRIFSGLKSEPNGSVEPLHVELAATRKGEEPRLDLTGIGAVLTSTGDAFVVKDVLEGGGAKAAGIGPGDAILAVDGVSTTELGFEQGVQRVRGPEGSVVVLSVRKGAGGEPFDLRVQRRRVVVR